MVEIVYLMAKYLDNKMRGELNTATGYLRQFAFLFYFTGFLGASFVPILARNLYGDSSGANFIAGLPYSVEALFNCVAILAVAPIFRTYGWKPPYTVGALVFSSGLMLSAMAESVYFFIFARAIVGLGYGLCWMTMRNIATISDDRVENFGKLTAGTYAGVMSGIAFGAVLADKIGYSGALLASAGLSLVVLMFPMIIRNERPPETAHSAGVNIRLAPQDFAVLGVFLILIVIPTVIADAFCDYVAPLYINDLGLPTAYVGRASLLYNLCVVYIGTTVMMKLVLKIFESDLMRNVSHMVLISMALFGAAYMDGLAAMLVAAMILGMADGFGFSVQNTYVLSSKVGQKLGTAQALTYFSLFKKFAAMLAPLTFSVFLGMDGGFAVMAVIFAGCAVVCLAVMTLINRGRE
jgi:MFS family permease